MIRIAYKDNKSGYKISICIIEYKNLNDEKVRSFLGNYELEYLVKFKYEKIKRQFIWGRVAAKYAIENIDNNIIFNKINIIKGNLNEPVIKGLKNNDLRVSLSHSNGVTIAVAYQTEISCGIDMEYISETSKKWANKIVKNEEVKLLSEIIEDQSLIGIYLWTIKEAMAKNIVKGLSLPLSSYEINKFYKCNDVYCGCYSNFKNYSCLCKKYKEYIITISIPANYKIMLLNKEKIVI